jgi:hypothetical protein
MALIILPALFLGLIIGIYEAVLLHRDVAVPTHRFGHMLHALVYAVIAVFATMNVAFVAKSLTFLPAFLQSPLVLQGMIGVITMIKIHGSSAAIRGSVGGSVGMKETWVHSFVISGLVVAAPYIWMFLGPMMPSWLQ